MNEIVVRSFEGKGRLENNESKVIRVEYAINEYEDRIPAGNHQNPSATIPGLHSFGGRLRSTATKHYQLFDWSGDFCILHLKDGKKLKVFLKTTDGDSAEVKATGGLF